MNVVYKFLVEFCYFHVKVRTCAANGTDCENGVCVKLFISCRHAACRAEKIRKKIHATLLCEVFKYFLRYSKNTKIKRISQILSMLCHVPKGALYLDWKYKTKKKNHKRIHKNILKYFKNQVRTESHPLPAHSLHTLYVPRHKRALNEAKPQTNQRKKEAG